MPPEVRIVESRTHRQHREQHQKASQHCREREDPS
jgi:hypothetical protein